MLSAVYFLVLEVNLDAVSLERSETKPTDGEEFIRERRDDRAWLHPT